MNPSIGIYCCCFVYTERNQVLNSQCSSIDGLCLEFRFDKPKQTLKLYKEFRSMLETTIECHYCVLNENIKVSIKLLLSGQQMSPRIRNALL